MKRSEKEIFDELVKLAQEYQIVILTATQIRRTDTVHKINEPESSRNVVFVDYI